MRQNISVKEFCLMHETVKNHCKHEDCIYRSYIDGGSTPICFYAVVAGESRKCRISECDKYVGGKRIKPYMTKDDFIEWEYEIYGRNVDSLWKRIE